MIERSRISLTPTAALLALALTSTHASAQIVNLSHPKLVLSTQGVSVGNDRIRFTFDRAPVGHPDAGLVRLSAITDLASNTPFDWTTTQSLIDVQLADPVCGQAGVETIRMTPADAPGAVHFSKWNEPDAKILQIYWNGAQPSGSSTWNPNDSVDVILEVRVPDGADYGEWRVGVDVHSATYDVKRTDLLFDYHQFDVLDKVLAPSFNGQIYTNLAGKIKTSNLLDFDKGHPWRKYAPIYAFWSPDVDDRGVAVTNRDPSGFHAEGCWVDDVPNHAGVVRLMRAHHAHTYGLNFPPASGTKEHRAAYPLALSVFEGGAWGAVEQLREWLLTTPMVPALTIDANPDIPQSWREMPLVFVQNVAISKMGGSTGAALPGAFAALRDTLAPPALVGARESSFFQWSWFHNTYSGGQWSTTTSGSPQDGFGHYEPHPDAISFFQGLGAQGFLTGAYTLPAFGSLNGPDSWMFPAHAALDGACQPITQKDAQGVPILYLMKPHDVWWQSRFQSIAVAAQQSLGIDFVYFDNPWYSPGDEERNGDQFFAGFFDLMKGVRDALRVANPDAMVAFEGFHPMYSKLLTSQTIGADERAPDLWMNDAHDHTENFPLLEALVGDRVLFTIGGHWNVTSPWYTQPLLQSPPDIVGYGEGILANVAGSFRWGRMIAHGELQADPSLWVDQFWTTAFGTAGQPAQDMLDEYVQFVGRLAAVRLSEARKFLVGGQLVKPPALSGEGTQTREFRYKQIDGYYTDIDGNPSTDESPFDITYPKVMSSMWKAADGSLGLMLINYNLSEKSITWSVDPAQYGLAPGTWFVRSLDASCPGVSADEMRFELTDLDPQAANSVTLAPTSAVFYEIRGDVPNAGEGAVTAQFQSGTLDELVKVAGSGAYSIANGKLSTSGENTFLLPGCRRLEQTISFDVGRHMPIGAVAGVIVNSASDTSSFASDAQQVVVYVERSAAGLTGKLWIGDSASTHVGALVPNSTIDPSQSGFRMRVVLDDGAVRAWVSALTNPLGAEAPLFGAAGYSPPLPGDGGWTLLYGHAAGGSLGLDNVLVRNSESIPHLFLDSSQRLWLSLVKPGVGVELTSGAPDFEFVIGGVSHDWPQFVNAFVPSLFTWSTIDPHHAVLVSAPLTQPLGALELRYDGQTDSGDF